jgi:NAD-dependent SIR2 family protein deacetylase
VEINLLPIEERKKYKQCTHCYKVKPLGDYFKRSVKGDRKRMAHCKDCERASRRFYKLKANIFEETL